MNQAIISRALKALAEIGAVAPEVAELALGPADHCEAAPAEPISGSMPSVSTPMLEIPTCCHCGAESERTGRCDCSTCGEPGMLLHWRAGPCRACLASQQRLSRPQ